MSTNNETLELQFYRKQLNNLKVWALIDSRELDTFVSMELFLWEIDAKKTQESMGKDAIHFEIFEIKVTT